MNRTASKMRQSLSRLQRRFTLSSSGKAGLIFGLSVLLGACSSGTQGDQGGPKAVPVVVGNVIQKTVPIQLRVIGNVQPYTTIIVKTMIGGQITRVHFGEGQDVRKGELLFTIDPRPYEASLKQAEANLERDLAQVRQSEANLEKYHSQVVEAEANLARDAAQAKYAEEEVHRYQALFDRGVVGKEQYDRFRANSEALEATVRADRAAVENAQAAVRAGKAALQNAGEVVRADRAAVEYAKIQLGYCFVYSPIDGRTGSLLVQQGNVVKANDINLVVINQINPIYVGFSVPEKNLSEIKKYMAEGKLNVEAILPAEENRPEHGVLTFVDNEVDKSTGTIVLKGTFANREKRLWPGQFVNVVLTLTSRSSAVLVPSHAIQTGQQGQYIFVVKPDLTVESRAVIAGQELNGETLIEKGLKPGEQVVTDGQLRLVPGAKIEIKPPNSAPTPGVKAK